MKQFFLLCALALPPLSGVLGQKGEPPVIFTNSQDIQEGRYRDIKGSPFLFEDYVLATIVSANIDVYENIWVNYNGHTKGFEARNGNRFIELDERWYLRVEIDPEVNPGLIKEFGKEKLIFQRGIHPKLENVFVNVLYPGLRTIFFRTFESDLTKQKIESPGQTLQVQRFVNDYTYYIMIDGDLHPVALRKKNFLKVLGGGKEIESFIKENDIDFSSEKDVIRLVEFYDKNL